MFQAIDVHSTSARPAVAAALSTSELVDEFGALKAQVADLTAREKTIKDQLAAMRARAEESMRSATSNGLTARDTTFKPPAGPVSATVSRAAR